MEKKRNFGEMRGKKKEKKKEKGKEKRGNLSAAWAWGRERNGGCKGKET